MRRTDDVKADVMAALRHLALERQPGAAGAAVADFLSTYYGDAAPEDLAHAEPIDLYGSALAHRELLSRHRPGEISVRVVAPRFEVHGWASRHAAVQVVIDDVSFVVDSVRMAISLHDLGIHVLYHPIIDGVSLVHVDVDRHAEAVAEELTATLKTALGEVQESVRDWGEMRAALTWSTDTLLAEGRGHVPGDELDEAVAFLRWLCDDHFTFLGVRDYEVRRTEPIVVVGRLPDTGLGILRTEAYGADEMTLSPAAGRIALQCSPLVLTKSNAIARVHRPTRMDYVGVKRFSADGRVVGERRFLGLYTRGMYSGSAANIPLLRRKIEIVLERAGFAEGTHSRRDLVAILDTYPRDELVQIEPPELCDIAVGIHQLQERRKTRLFLRADPFERFWSALVYLPRDRYNTDTRLAIERLLLEALGGQEVTYEARVSESTLARLHYVVYAPVGGVSVDVTELESRIAAAVRDWGDDLHDLLIEEFGEDEGVSLAHRYRRAFSAGYRSEHPARIAVSDICRLEALGPEGIDFHLYRHLESPPSDLRLRVYRAGPDVLVSELVPILEHLGATVTDQRPFRVEPADALDEHDHRHVYDVGLQVRVEVDVDHDAGRVVDALQAVFDRRTVSDSLHQLLFSADLTWRQVAIVRAYGRYLRQAGIPFSPSYVEDCITAHPAIAAALVGMFEARLRPPGDPVTAAAFDGQISAMLDGVASLDEDRVLRWLFHLVRATLRTNAYQPDATGVPKAYLSFKFDPSGLPDLPLPRPHREVFVYSPRVEGVHLRGAAVARGGLRWSDRREDYRTEILGLLKAQMVKNAVIVPSGAKGGFVVKQPPSDPDALREEVVACYRTFVSGLLDLTDNLVGEEVVPPENVHRLDGDDAYLVVAADKGTATFSDLANEVSSSYDFWLGDAFASGGSAGYDHKGMGITARGAWESVKRHFRELGVDAEAEPITVVGIGDMSGDVFGNGMLLSPHLRLVAAFNHQHVFLDPHPDAAVSFAERKRLFDLPRSTWDDYDRSLISVGGGIHPRSAKSIGLTPEVRDLLGIEAEALTPTALISALLTAPVDLLWNGGIGTYVKARAESHGEVGDKANDSLRVNGADLRCRVVAEGGNLGLTQRARVEFARKGGRVNTDAIDNSAGVDCSDHEVNIKIVLDAVVAAGDLTHKQRSELLTAMTGDVASLVLADNVRQNQALVNAIVQAPSLVDVHLRYLRYLDANGQIDRAVEYLPTDDELAERKAAGEGLTSPEFAVLLAYTKNLLTAELLEGDLADDPWCDGVLLGYFPPTLRDRFPDQIRRHRLRREIVATLLANDLVDHQGITSLFRLRDETGASASEVGAAMLAATEIFQLRRFRAEVGALDHQVSGAVQTHLLLEARKLAERGARWLLRSRANTGLETTIERFAAGTSTLMDVLPRLLVGSERTAFEDLVADLGQAAVPPELASWAAEFEELFGALDCVELAAAADQDVTAIAAVRFQLEERLGLRWLMDEIIGLSRDNRWQSLARLSMREDLLIQIRRLTGLVVSSTGPGLDPAERVSTWVAANDSGVARLAHVLADIRATGPADVATLSVGLREVTQLA